jgi:hypothetical protein
LIRAVVAAGAVGWVATATAAPQAVYVREDENFTNPAFVRVDDEAKAALFSAEQLLAAGDVATALQRLQAMLDLKGEGLVEFGARTLLAPREVAIRKLDLLPPPMKVRYDELFGGAARAALDRARAARDPDALLAVADRYPIAASATEALRLALGVAAERGLGTVARRAVLRLEALGALRALDIARALQCFVADGDDDAARSFAARFATRGAESLRIGGAQGSLSDASASILAESRSGPAIDYLRAPLELAPLGMHTSTEHHLEDDPTLRTFNPLRDLESVAPVAVHALRQGARTLVSGRFGIYVHDGLAPEDPRSPIFQYSALFGTDSPVIDIDSPNLELATDGERLHLAVTRRVGTSFERGAISGAVAALEPDLSQRAGAIAWSWRGPLIRDDSLEDYAFVSPPAFLGDLVLYSASRLRAVSECALFAFDRRTGELRYARFLASAGEVAEFELRNQESESKRVIPSPVVVRDGIAYVVTNLGIVAAVDAQSGETRWVFKYNRMAPIDVDRYRKDQILDTGGWIARAPVVTADRLIVTPSDSRFLYVLARDPGPDGSIILEDPFHKADRVELVGYDARRERLLFEARSVEQANVDGILFDATDLAGVYTGGRGWRVLKFEHEEQRVGRCVVIGDCLVVPILPPRAWIELNEQRYFGNLRDVGSELVSTSARFTVAIRPK